jgi:hypothetical protein
MGVGYQGLLIALMAKRRKVDFSRTIMLGRQNHYHNEYSLRTMFDRFGVSLSSADVQAILKDDYSEGLFRKLGARVVDSIDASSYEGANIVHDMNRPIAAELTQKYTCVIDFGTLEHIFNFPAGLKNAIDLLAVGGTFLSSTGANNFMGHGFYQFSPELFYGFLPANGFDRTEVYLVPWRDFPYLFEVSNPAAVGGRVELVNGEPVMMHVIARKAKHIPQMVSPIQSDYAQTFWHGRDVNRQSRLPDADPQIASAITDLKRRTAALMTWPETVSPSLVPGFENSLHYRLIDPTKV